MKKCVENDFATFRLEKGILHITYKENVSIFLKQAMEIVSHLAGIDLPKSYVQNIQ